MSLGRTAGGRLVRGRTMHNYKQVPFTSILRGGGLSDVTEHILSTESATVAPRLRRGFLAIHLPLVQMGKALG